MGDFPAKWNTNGSGKIVKIDGIDGRWLEVYTILSSIP